MATKRMRTTRATPACGGFPEVPGETVQILGKERIDSVEWLRVRYTRDGTMMLLHPSRLAPEVR